ncbi:MAG: ARMT1-like domain-containing protein [Candidatus Margulisbacteria bacterium]|nr:ARMT1-like domain-containing protein [Candidatus Margulisiibacteriota bacterium]
MKAFLQCVPCIFSQIARILCNFEPDIKKREKIFRSILADFSKQDFSKHTPPSLTREAHEIMKKEIGRQDLYVKEKKECNEKALLLFKDALNIYEKSANRLETAIKIAIAGNLIDYGALSEFDIQHVVDDYTHRDFSINDYPDFAAILEKSNKILYVLDNAGEIVFDKILVTELLNLDKEVIATVKSQPILNDALLDDALEVSMTKLVKVIPSGSTTAGTVFSEATPELREALDWADMIISKGQGNFETLSEEKTAKPLFYLLLSKCPHISKNLGIKKFDLILMANWNYEKYLKTNC